MDFLEQMNKNIHLIFFNGLNFWKTMLSEKDQLIKELAPVEPVLLWYGKTPFTGVHHDSFFLLEGSFFSDLKRLWILNIWCLLHFRAWFPFPCMDTSKLKTLSVSFLWNEKIINTFHGSNSIFFSLPWERVTGMIPSINSFLCSSGGEITWVNVKYSIDLFKFYK